MMKPKVSAVIPCLNEEKTLPICIKKVLNAFTDLGVPGEVVVGDNGSDDKSVEIAQKLGARVIHQEIRGYGAALRAAIESSEGDYIIMADADDSYDWYNISPFIQKLDQGYDFAIGNRFKGTIFPGAMPFLHRYVGNPILSGISRHLYSVSVGDFHCGMRAFTRQAYDKMNLKTQGMEFATEMIVKAARSNLSIAEVPINLFPDKRDRPPHLRTFRDGWRHLRFIMTYAPNHLYLAPGALMFFSGLILMLFLVRGPLIIGRFYIGIHFLALGLLLTMVGLNIITQGLVAKVYLGDESPGLKNKIVNWLTRYFTLERGLLFGGLLFSVGFLVDLYLLYRWIFLGGAMTTSIHLAFVATGLLSVGCNIIFFSFLLWMLLNNYNTMNGYGKKAIE
jgi:glycosyltransferase involved in cell wall biosynthesis